MLRSVVLAGVTDVRHLKVMTRSDEASGVSCPWNIAADYDVVMSFSVADVADMLAYYETVHTTGTGVASVAAELVAWMGGTPSP